MVHFIYIVFGLQTHKEIYFHLILFRLVVSKTGVQGGTKTLLKKYIYIIDSIIRVAP